MLASHRAVLIFWKCVWFVASVVLLPVGSRAQTTVFPEWTARFDGAHLSDAPKAIATDALGNSYVTGSITVGTSASPDQEAMTVKYDADGHLLWRAFISSPVHAAQGVDVAVDSAGNVYVLAQLWLTRTNGTPTESEFCTAKYNPSGTRLWITFLRDSNPSVNNVPSKLALSPKGNAYVTGASGAGNPGELLTARYSSAGALQWVRKKTEASASNYLVTASGIGFDALENAYVGAFSTNTTFNNPPFQDDTGEIVRYDPNGNLLAAFNVPFTGGISALQVASNGTSYAVTAPTGVNNNFNPRILKFDATGDLLGSFLVSICPTTNCSFHWGGIVLDQHGNVYAAGTNSPSTSGPQGSTDIIILKLDANLSVMYEDFFNTFTDHSSADSVAALDVNSFGHLYLAGAATTPTDSGTDPTGPTDILTVKLDANGTAIWQLHYHGPGAGKDAGVAMKIGGDGGLFVTGVSQGAGSSTDWVTIDYVQDGLAFSVPSHTTYTFDPQAVGTSSAAQTVVINNSSNVDTHILSIVTTGDFHQTNTCPPVLGPGLACGIDVTFTPTATGIRTGTLTITDEWEGTPRKASLTGTGQ